MPIDVAPFFHAATGTWSYVVADPATRVAAIVDPVLDYEPHAARTHTWTADALLAHVHEKKLDLAWILETHAHADHLSAGAYVRRESGAKLGIGGGIVAVQRHFRGVFGLSEADVPDGAPFDRLFTDGETFELGASSVQVMATPGHTADSLTYLVGDAAFIGDTLFAPDVGTARCDFPGGDAATLWASIQRLLALPPATRLFLAHDYPPKGRAPRAMVTVAEQREHNRLVAGMDAASYVAARRERDTGLDAPRLLLPSLQVNIRGGELPPPDANGVRYLRLPLDTVG